MLLLSLPLLVRLHDEKLLVVEEEHVLHPLAAKPLPRDGRALLHLLHGRNQRAPGAALRCHRGSCRLLSIHDQAVTDRRVEARRQRFCVLDCGPS